MNSAVQSAEGIRDKRRLQMTNRIPNNRQSGVTAGREGDML